jgi:hypothetical protein
MHACTHRESCSENLLDGFLHKRKMLMEIIDPLVVNEGIL